MLLPRMTRRGPLESRLIGAAPYSIDAIPALDVFMPVLGGGTASFTVLICSDDLAN